MGVFVVLATCNLALMGVTLAGLAWRRRMRAPATLPLYLLCGIVLRVPFVLWLERFYVRSYWLLTEVVCAGLGLALSVELALLAFRRLRLVRRWAGAVTAAVLVSILGLFSLTAPAGAADAAYGLASWRASQAKLGAGWVCALTLVLASRFRVPLEPLHRDVAAGFTLWAFVQAWSTELAALDPILGLGRQGLQVVIYMGVLIAWAWAAWRRDPQSALSPTALRVLRPWRVPA